MHIKYAEKFDKRRDDFNTLNSTLALVSVSNRIHPMQLDREGYNPGNQVRIRGNGRDRELTYKLGL